MGLFSSVGRTWQPSYLGCNTNLGCAVWCTSGVRGELCLLWIVGLSGSWAHEGGFSEGLWEFTLQDTELHLCFLFVTHVKWNGSFSLILTIQHGQIY